MWPWKPSRRSGSPLPEPIPPNRGVRPDRPEAERTSPPREPEPRALEPPTRANAGPRVLLGVGLAVLVVLAVVVLRGTSHPGRIATPTPTATQSASASLPASSNRALEASASFDNSGGTVSDQITDPVDTSTTLTALQFKPVLRGFELVVEVHADFSEKELQAISGSPQDEIAGSCIDVVGPAQNGFNGDRYTLKPLRSALADSGSTVTGTITIPAVLPGDYQFNYECNGAGDRDSLGHVTTPNLGIAYGGSLNNGAAVFSRAVSQSDVTVSYGAVGSSSDSSSLGSPTRAACITDGYAGPDASQVLHPTDSRVINRVEHNGTWYELGTLTFNLPASQLSGHAFFYNCAHVGESPVELG